jgi:hypothetical protein
VDAIEARIPLSDKRVLNRKTTCSWRCVVIGGGEGNQPELFERVVNLVRRHAPDAAIAFNATPADTFEAAARRVQIPG